MGSLRLGVQCRATTYEVHHWNDRRWRRNVEHRGLRQVIECIGMPANSITTRSQPWSNAKPKFLGDCLGRGSGLSVELTRENGWLIRYLEVVQLYVYFSFTEKSDRSHVVL